jgi:fumarate reductase subunit D
MAMSNKPLVWLPFAAGGTVAAFVLPAMMVVVLLASLNLFASRALAYESLHAFAVHPLGALVIAGVLGLSLWHAAHRLRMTVQDLGVRSEAGRRSVARLCYAAASMFSALLLYALGALLLSP